MGLSAAGYMSRDKILVIAGRTVAKLEKAKNVLEAKGFTVYPHAVDSGTDRDLPSRGHR